jgi:NAD(P)-dependent dehydrogenase (short-subunit alcohol dehydrogenase family)
MSADTKSSIYVVTGGNRGIGLGLVKTLLTRPHTTVIATVRNGETANSLRSEISASVQSAEKSSLHIVELDFSSAPSPQHVSELFAGLGLDHIDVLISNAGVSPPMLPAVQTPAEDLRLAFEVNAIAPLMVFQGLWPLLQKSANPKVVMMTSSVGCITFQELSGGSYGPSKAALNWITRALHLQNESSGLVAVALHPGWVQTRMGEQSAKDWGYPHQPPDTIESSVKGILEVVDSASRETVSGKFVTYQGQILPW